jgi:L-asparaginase
MNSTKLTRTNRLSAFARLSLFVLCGLTCAPLCLAGQGREAARPRVWVLATGGTIAAKGTSTTDLTNYRSGTLLGEELIRAVPEIKKYADVQVEQVLNVASYDLTFDNWKTIAGRVNQIFSNDPTVAGIVVTHGTSTLEETAYFLNLTVKHDRPVVVVGSMRPPTAISAEGPLNLLNAVRTAASPAARGKGVLVVMNDEINAARDVTKTSTLRVEAFRSPDLGILGYVDEDKVAFYRATTKRHTVNSEFDLENVQQLPKVEIVYSSQASSTIAITALIESGVHGIVFAGSGAGSLSNEYQATLRAVPLERRPVLVRSSRVGSGRVIPRIEFEPLGMIAGDNLNPQKARILLMLALTKTTDLSEIQRLFDEY